MCTVDFIGELCLFFTPKEEPVFFAVLTTDVIVLVMLLLTRYLPFSASKAVKFGAGAVEFSYENLS